MNQGDRMIRIENFMVCEKKFVILQILYEFGISEKVGNSRYRL